MNEVQANTGDMRSTMTELLGHLEDLDNLLVIVGERFENSRSLYDTPSAKYFREIANDYIIKEKRYIKDTLVPLVNELGTLSNEYDELFETDNATVESIEI